MYHKDIKKFLFDRIEIEGIARDLAEEIKKKYKGKEVILLGILKGCFIFLADLIRELSSMDLKIDFLLVSSYGNESKSSGEVKIILDTKIDLKNKNVIIVEDIVDTGYTLSKLVEILQKREPASLEICALLDKAEARKVKIKIDYLGSKVPNEFIVGCGLDYAERYRQLPGVGILKEEIYMEK